MKIECRFCGKPIELERKLDSAEDDVFVVEECCDRYEDGHYEGYEAGRDDGYSDGEENGFREGRIEGYDEGYNDHAEGLSR